MGLLPIVGKALGLFSFLSVSALAISYILYKMRSPKTKPYNRTSLSPYEAQQNLHPGLQAPYYPVPAMAVPERMAATPGLTDVPQRNNFSERTYAAEKVNVEERVSQRTDAHERRQAKKVHTRPRSKFQILQSNEDGEIKAYHLPTGSGRYSS